MVETKISFVSEFDEQLVGLEAVPELNQTKYPTILLVHGFGVTKEEKGLFNGLTKKLSKNGFLVYRFDFSGMGESEGDYAETSITKQRMELANILSWVRQQPLVDNSNFGILAQSFGTSVTASLIPEVNAMVFTGSLSDPAYYFEHKSKWVVLDKQGVSTKTKSSGETISLKPQFWKEFDNYNLLESISEINCPIFFIHGSADDHVPLSSMESFYNHANDPKKKYVLKEADHGLEPRREEAYELVLNWFKKYLC